MRILRIYHPHADNIGVQSNVSAHLPKELESKVFGFEWIKSNTEYSVEFISYRDWTWKGIGQVKQEAITKTIRTFIKDSLRQQQLT